MHVFVLLLVGVTAGCAFETPLPETHIYDRMLDCAQAADADFKAGPSNKTSHAVDGDANNILFDKASSSDTSCAITNAALLPTPANPWSGFVARSSRCELLPRLVKVTTPSAVLRPFPANSWSGFTEPTGAYVHHACFARPPSRISRSHLRQHGANRTSALSASDDALRHCRLRAR